MRDLEQVRIRAELSDGQWAVIEPLMPQVSGRSRPYRDHRQVVEGIVHRYRCGVAWRDLPERFGPWQTVWKRHARFSRDGTWDKVLAAVIAHADAAGDIDWVVSVDSTVNRAHQHATNLPRAEIPTGGIGELHESVSRSRQQGAARAA
jgi:transposase